MCSGYIEPADNIEYFLGEIFASSRRGGGHMRSVFDAAYLTRRYRNELTLLAVCWGEIANSGGEIANSGNTEQTDCTDYTDKQKA